MSSMTNTILVNGLSSADTSATDSAQLLDAKDDSGNFMPPSRSPSPGNGIPFNAFFLRSAEKLEWDTRRNELTREYNASRPAQQWEDETSEELDHMEQWFQERGVPITVVKSISNFKTHWPRAKERVRESWIRQGIWEDDWGKAMDPWSFEMPSESAWKHEVEPGSDSETEGEEEAPSTTIFDAFVPSWKTRQEMQRRAERQATRQREREASRPFHRFIYQMGEERFRLQGRPFRDDSEVLDLFDINTQAYETVKARWIERGIWDRRWGKMPGMKWKHQQDLEGFLIEELGPRPSTETGRAKCSVGEAVSSCTGSPQVTEPYHNPEPSVVGAEDERPLVNAGRTRMHDRDANQSSPATNLWPTPSELAQGAPSTIARARQSAGAQIMRRRLGRRTAGKGRRLARPAGVSKLQPKSTLKSEYEESRS
ncbi:hypothetical protein PG993_005859 [Apiospora rasikravindrae]|uniref:Uncharacterized protein n=1 Tax=Apiospora rasikravindrae TaxID=990691 RepID=A0ABR1TCC3_9PEZI